MNASIIDQRKHRRRPANLAVVLVKSDESERKNVFFIGQIRDVSMGGIRVVTNKACKFQRGDKFEIYIKHPESEDGDAHVQIGAEVVWYNPSTRNLGMKFDVNPFVDY